MTTKDVPQRFPSGTVEVVYSNSKVVSVAMQIMFILLGGYFFWVMLHESSLLAKADNVIILAFCLWRIDRQGDHLSAMYARKESSSNGNSCRFLNF